MLQTPTFRFSLRDDFHQECGWQRYVSDQASRNPQVIRVILEKRTRYDFGPDPRTLIERWEPFTMGCMFYFFMIRPGQTAPSFVATDAVFSMIVDPLPRNEHLLGLPADLLELVNESITRGGGSAKPSPIMPVQVENLPAQTMILPDLMVVHRYGDGVAYLRPCAATLKALDADPIAWTNREPRPEASTG